MGIIFLVGLGIYLYIHTICSSINDMRNRDIARNKNKKWYMDSQNKIRSVKTNRRVSLMYNKRTKTYELMDIDTYIFENDGKKLWD